MLYSSLHFRNLELPNRWVLSPMCMYSAQDGVANDFHFVHYNSRAIGGVGLVMVEATAVEPIGRITHKCLGLWNDKHQDAFEKITQFIHTKTAAKVGIQLAHAGRKASTWNGVQLPSEQGWQTVAPSAIAYKDGELSPRALTTEEIKTTVHLFRSAARRAVEAGFDVIEIHAAHGYLIHQFLSPLSNLRTDEYGGSFENRARLLYDIVQAVKEEITEHHALFVRISADEYAENGWNIEHSITLATQLKKMGVDLIDVSSGGNIHGVSIPVQDGYQVPFAHAIRQSANIKTGAVGLITTARQAELILENNQADLIFVGRELLRNPYLPLQGAFESGAECFIPSQYERARP